MIEEEHLLLVKKNLLPFRDFLVEHEAINIIRYVGFHVRLLILNPKVVFFGDYILMHICGAW